MTMFPLLSPQPFLTGLGEEVRHQSDQREVNYSAEIQKVLFFHEMMS